MPNKTLKNQGDFMKNMKQKINVAVVITIAVVCLSNVSAENYSNVQLASNEVNNKTTVTKDTNQFVKMIDDTTEVYKTITKGSDGKIPAKVLSQARCIAVLPSVITGAFVIGGTHGDGLVSCKSDTGTWSQPAAITLNQGSLGIQAGAKSTDLVIFFQSQEAVSALKRGSFVLGTNVSAVAGNYDATLDTSRAGLVVYARTEGVFAGATINESSIGKDQEQLEKDYLKKVDFVALLEDKISPDMTGNTKKLTSLFPL